MELVSMESREQTRLRTGSGTLGVLYGMNIGVPDGEETLSSPNPSQTVQN